MTEWTPGPVKGWDLWPGWHDDAIDSDGISATTHCKPPPSTDDLPEEVRDAISAALPLYEEMHASRLRVAR